MSPAQRVTCTYVYTQLLIPMGQMTMKDPVALLALLLLA